jgi:C4-dicarboxylate-specific signal transduction histidine kinase
VIGSIRAIFKRDARSRTSLDINDLIGEALVLLRGDLQKHRIFVQTEADAQLPQVVGDRIQLQQVLLNLITNAIEPMVDEDGPRILSDMSSPHRNDVLRAVAEIKGADEQA